MVEVNSNYKLTLRLLWANTNWCQGHKVLRNNNTKIEFKITQVDSVAK